MIQQVILNDNIELLKSIEYPKILFEVARWVDNDNVNKEIDNKKRFEIIRFKLAYTDDDIIEFISKSKKHTRVYACASPVYNGIIRDLEADEQKVRAHIDYYCKNKYYLVDVDCKDEQLCKSVIDIFNKYNIEYKTFESKIGYHFVVYENQTNIKEVTNEIYMLGVKSWKCMYVILKYPKII